MEELNKLTINGSAENMGSRRKLLTLSLSHVNALLCFWYAGESEVGTRVTRVLTRAFQVVESDQTVRVFARSLATA